MKSFIALALLSILLKMCQGNHDGQLANSGVLTKGNPNTENHSLLFLKRFYDGLSYDGFVGLMGRRMADTKEMPVAQKRDMNDFFVGLMGRRNMEFGLAGPFNLQRNRDHSKKVIAPSTKVHTFPNKPLNLFDTTENYIDTRIAFVFKAYVDSLTLV